MNKKFFSLFFLVTSMIVAPLSAEALRILNASKSVIYNITLTYSEGRFSSTNDIRVAHLNANQTGTTNFDDETKSVRVYTVTYTDNNGKQIVKNLNGQEFYLPAEFILNQGAEESVHFIHNEAAHKQAEEAALLHQASIQATKAKDTIVDTTKNAAQWVADTSKSAYETAKETASTVYDKVRGKAEDLKEGAKDTVQSAKELAQDAIEAAQKKATEVKHTTQETAQRAQHTAEEKALQAKHAAEEAAQKAKHAAEEKTKQAKDTVQEEAQKAKNTAQETVDKSFHTADEIIN